MKFFLVFAFGDLYWCLALIWSQQKIRGSPWSIYLSPSFLDRSREWKCSPPAWFTSKITLGGTNTQSYHPSSASVGHIFGSRVDTSESVPRLFPRHFGDGLFAGTRRLILIPITTSERSRGQVFLLFWASWHTEKDARHSETIACLLSGPDRKRLMFVRVWLDWFFAFD